jgi:FkbH-like protein
MNKLPLNGLLISDFNLSNLAGYLNNDADTPTVRTRIAPFGQVVPVLMNGDLECWETAPDFAVVWTQPQSVIKAFNDLINCQQISLETLLAEIDQFSSSLINLSHRIKFALITSWSFPQYPRAFSLLDMKSGGIAHALMQMNLRLSENLEKIPNLYLLNSQKWLELSGKDAFNPKLWYMGKIPFSNTVFKEAVQDIKSALRGLHGAGKKLLILDLDDTLWGGIVGEIGWRNLNLGGHDHTGEAFVDFQQALKALTNRGILLAIVSKNEEAVALEAIERHPEMVLQLSDFAGWRINWRDKAENIVDLVAELHLGLHSAVFIDDNPVERARVREALPEVFVPEWPEDKMLYKRALLSLPCFDMPSVTTEDLQRMQFYLSDRQREGLKSRLGSLEEWFENLGTVVTVEELTPQNLQRTTQLFNKTNQLNLSTRRMTDSELLAWAAQDGRKFWTVRVADKFGDAGLTGLLSLERHDTHARIVDFILSCRVMGRKIEETMLHVAIEHARSLGVEKIVATYIRTAHNKPCLDFWQRSGFRPDPSNTTFSWNLHHDYPLPAYINVEAEQTARGVRS